MRYGTSGILGLSIIFSSVLMAVSALAAEVTFSFRRRNYSRTRREIFPLGTRTTC
jgi:uncharacterized membrane protein YkvI